ncbi:MAG: response regulator [Myxococcales bacterium]|nr:response regulator [Myxococcales bacterium]
MSKEWNVLLVEDDSDAAALLKTLLSDVVNGIRIARTGQEAILVTGSRTPDLVIMDLMLPELDGFEASRYFKHKFADTCVPILVLTANPDAAARERISKIGCEAIMAKPYEPDQLVDMVRGLVSLANAERALVEAQAQAAAGAEPKKKGWFGRGKREDAEPVDLSSFVKAACDARAETLALLDAVGAKDLFPIHLDRLRSLDPNHPSISEYSASAAEGQQ